ncbi:hypothetical protein AB0F91_46600 [Amycolatopsis sp. NPDC023774]|uniref:hypothetical protein n=1 Tax=Amycolatopsis sp. NPDC023774 TaxID=3155015 RepID=UPI0033F9385F
MFVFGCTEQRSCALVLGIAGPCSVSMAVSTSIRVLVQPFEDAPDLGGAVATGRG